MPRLKKSFSTIGHFWTALSARKCSPEHQDNTSQQKHRGKKLVLCTTVFSKGCFSSQLCMCSRISVQFDADPAAVKMARACLFLPLRLMSKSLNQWGLLMYIWCVSISRRQDISIVIPSDTPGSIADSKLMASRKKRKESVWESVVSRNSQKKKRQKGCYGRLQQKYVLYMCVHCSSLSVREREKKRNFWPTWAERGQ